MSYLVTSFSTLILNPVSCLRYVSTLLAEVLGVNLETNTPVHILFEDLATLGCVWLLTACRPGAVADPCMMLPLPCCKSDRPV